MIGLRARLFARGVPGSCKIAAETVTVFRTGMGSDQRLSADFNVVFEAAPGRVEPLRAELAWRGLTVVAEVESLIYARGPVRPLAWAQNTWFEPRLIRIDSIGAAVRELRAIQRNWWLTPTTAYRRAALIAEGLPSVRAAALEFPAAPPTAELGAWTLVDRNTLVASATTSSRFAGGCPQFVEDRSGPPNRAYLKLWEALVLARCRPEAGQTVLDLGAAPGGWSWVAATLGASVIAVDRADLSPNVAAIDGVSVWRGDAFKVDVNAVGRPDWVICDVAAYPERLVALAEYWANAVPTATLIMTIKFRGTADMAVVAALEAIPGACVLHLGANKNELTFFRLPGGGPPEAGVANPTASKY